MVHRSEATMNFGWLDVNTSLRTSSTMLISEEPEKASDAGLVIAIGGGMYRIHPAANSYLEQLWRFKEGPN
jgi:hypothetical protein